MAFTMILELVIGVEMAELPVSLYPIIMAIRHFLI